MGWIDFIKNTPPTPEGVEKVDQVQNVGINYDTSWSNTSVAKLIREVGVWGFMKPAINIYGSPKVIGAERLKNVKGPVVFVANHHSHADTTLLLATIPAHLRKNLSIAAGADYFFPNKFASFISSLFIGAIPIERKRISKLSMKNALKAIKSGNNLLIFPEGSRSPDGLSQPHKPGAAYIAIRTESPVVPIYIDGTGQVLPKGKNWPTKHQCAVVFGDPMVSEKKEDPRDYAVRIQKQIDVLADEYNSGWWKAKTNAAAGKTPDLTGPEVSAWRRNWLANQPDKTENKKDSWPKI